jgi:hypothetical protein
MLRGLAAVAGSFVRASRLLRQETQRRTVPRTDHAEMSIERDDDVGIDTLREREDGRVRVPKAGNVAPAAATERRKRAVDAALRSCRAPERARLA